MSVTDQLVEYWAEPTDSASNAPLYQRGDIVVVESRMHGMNKPGGVGRIRRVLTVTPKDSGDSRIIPLHTISKINL